ncbi:MAG TPA: hypothetical protein VG387_14410 [Rhizomicrobium sp.]|jgi:hypothetical protein|nr:hypothetical protein [Rhizomicrobium sp.]
MLDVQHLLDLASKLANPGGAGAPRQVILRRAVSTAYYAVFHALCSDAAVTFVNAGVWKSRVLFYRAFDHGKTKDRCKKLGQNPLPNAERQFFLFESFGAEIRALSNTFVLLQELRHSCDYDPDFKITKSEAQQAALDAKSAIANLATADPQEKNQFLAYLLFGMRT